MSDTNLYMMGVLVEKRDVEAPEVQKVFTKYGQCILSRFGIHQCDESNGLISLNIKSTQENIKSFEKDLTSIKGVSVKHIMLK